MAEAILGNPVGAFNVVTTFVSGVDANGAEIEYGKSYRSYRTGAAVVRGEALMFVAPTATAPITVIKMTVAGTPRSFAGIALESAASGAVVRTCNEGHCLVFANAQTVAAGDAIRVPGTNAGEASFSAVAPDATTVVGTVLGIAFGVKASTAGANLAPCYIRQV